MVLDVSGVTCVTGGTIKINKVSQFYIMHNIQFFVTTQDLAASCSALTLNMRQEFPPKYQEQFTNRQSFPRRFECSVITFFITVLLGALNSAF